jgi:hypothetical protein
MAAKTQRVGPKAPKGVDAGEFQIAAAKARFELFTSVNTDDKMSLGDVIDMTCDSLSNVGLQHQKICNMAYELGVHKRAIELINRLLPLEGAKETKGPDVKKMIDLLSILTNMSATANKENMLMLITDGGMKLVLKLLSQWTSPTSVLAEGQLELMDMTYHLLGNLARDFPTKVRAVLTLKTIGIKSACTDGTSFEVKFSPLEVSICSLTKAYRSITTSDGESKDASGDAAPDLMPVMDSFIYCAESLVGMWPAASIDEISCLIPLLTSFLAVVSTPAATSVDMEMSRDVELMTVGAIHILRLFVMTCSMSVDVQRDICNSLLSIIDVNKPDSRSVSTALAFLGGSIRQIAELVETKRLFDAMKKVVRHYTKASATVVPDTYRFDMFTILTHLITQADAADRAPWFIEQGLLKPAAAGADSIEVMLLVCEKLTDKQLKELISPADRAALIITLSGLDAKVKDGAVNDDFGDLAERSIVVIGRLKAL